MAKASIDALNDMVKLINDSASSIFAANETLTEFMRGINWEDDKGKEFEKILDNLQKRLLTPISPLYHSREKVQELIELINKYNGLDF